MLKHINIPIFIPDQACPNQCVFCNQHRITGHKPYPKDHEIQEQIETWLSEVNFSITQVQIAFFGGNFTGLPPALMSHYLEMVQPYIHSGKISGIRISTRPDYIDENIIRILIQNNVKAIELGAQSLHNDVLDYCARGHTSADITRSSELIKAANIELGLQMMLGLPGDTAEKSINTAQKIIELKADTTRIYPTLVIKDTELEKWYHKNLYTPLSMNEAVSQAADVCEVFHHSNIKILRIGLHASEGLINKSDYIAGPFHPSFREMVNSEIWRRKIIQNLPIGKPKHIIIHVHSSHINATIGYQSSNKIWLKTMFDKVQFNQDNSIENNLIRIESY